MREYYVYIMTNKAGTALYTGVTNDIQRRISEHRDKRLTGFASKYSLTRLVYCEGISDIVEAITREKQIKGWTRAKKIALIEAANRHWADLSVEWDGEEGTEILHFALDDN